MWGTSYLDEGEDVLIIGLYDLEKKYDDQFFDQICERLAEKSKKVIFKLFENDHVLCMKKFVEDLQRMKALSTLPQEIMDCVIEKGKHYSRYHPTFWPDTWYIHVFLAGNNGTKLLIPFALWALPNVELICFESCQLKVPDFNYISQMKNLKVLNVERNDLTSLPTTLCLCKKLEDLRVAETDLPSLPACIRKMDNIKRITRLDSSNTFCMFLTDQSTHGGYPVKNVYSCDGRKMRTNSENNIKKSSPDTLFNLAGYATWKIEQDISSSSLRLPKYVINDLTYLLKKMKFCDHCNCAFSGKEYYTAKKEFRDFIGYKNIVFEAVACSSFCCESIYDQWTEIAEKEKDLQCVEQFCFDVEITDDHNWLRRNFCCF